MDIFKARNWADHGYNAIIFDLDGVIVSTDVYHYRAWKRLADSYGIYFDEKINNRLRGVSRMESLEIILERSGKIFTSDEKVLMADTKNIYYRELLEQMSPSDVSAQVSYTLERLRQSQIKLAIGSSSKNARFILERVGLVDFFDAISDGNNITHNKPDPEVFLKASKILGIMPPECAVVEDAKSGIIAAKRAGMFAVAIHDAAGCPEADISIGTFSELPAAIGLML